MVDVECSRLLRAVATMVFSMSVAAHADSGAAGKPPISIREAFDTTRVMVDANEAAVSISPDSRRYASMLIRGKSEQDGVEAELVVGGLEALADAVPRSIVKLFTRGFGGTMHGAMDSTKLLMPGTNFPVWLDGETIAFRWEDERGVQQVVAVDVGTKQWRFVTHSQTDVTGFSSGNANVIVFQAKRGMSLEQSDSASRDGYAISSKDALPLLIGAVSEATFLDIKWGVGDHFVVRRDRPGEPARKVRIEQGGASTYYLQWPQMSATVSPDGRWALISATPREPGAQWRRYNGATLGVFLREWQESRHAIHARQLQQIFLVSVDEAVARPLWDAPLMPNRFTKAAWSPDSKRVVLGPTYLPAPGASRAGLEGDAVVELEPLSGKYLELPLQASDARRIRSIRWVAAGMVAIEVGEQVRLFVRDLHRWRMAKDDEASGWKGPRVKVDVTEGPNAPPILQAIDRASGAKVTALDLNPGLTGRFALGKVGFVGWKDASGRNWEGRIFYPVGYRAGRRYPLVIQTHNWGRRESFTLYGRGGGSTLALGPGESIYLAQPLAGRGVAVLQIGPRPASWSSSDDRSDEARDVMLGITSAVDYLDSEELIDRGRVGIMGFSRSGWHVEYALAFAEFPFAAAIVCDNIDSGYFEAGMQGWIDQERRNGTEPFGAGLKGWLENAPALNAEHISAPLLMMITNSFAGRSGPVVQGWEMFSRLRYLSKPVEFFVAPMIERGSHNLHNPHQLLTVRERAMDWWLFWLKDEVDPAESKREQYASWRELKKQKLAQENARAWPRLRWTAEPVKDCAGKKC
jgi:hypothetical protein